MKAHGLHHEGKNDTSLILYADDQYVNHEALRMNLQDIGVASRLVTFANGQEVVDYFCTLLEDLKKAPEPHIRISLLLLDINMPILNGFETCRKVKELFRLYNSNLI